MVGTRRMAPIPPLQFALRDIQSAELYNSLLSRILYHLRSCSVFCNAILFSTGGIRTPNQPALTCLLSVPSRHESVGPQRGTSPELAPIHSGYSTPEALQMPSGSRAPMGLATFACPDATTMRSASVSPRKYHKTDMPFLKLQ